MMPVSPNIWCNPLDSVTCWRWIGLCGSSSSVEPCDPNFFQHLVQPSGLCDLLEVHKCAWNTTSSVCWPVCHCFPHCLPRPTQFCYVLEVHRCAWNTSSSICWHVWSLFFLAPGATPGLCYLLEVHRCAWNTSSSICWLTWLLFPPVPDATPWFCYLLEVHRCARNTTSSSCWHVWSLFSLAPDAAPRILLPAGGGQVCVRHAAGRWLAECRYHTHHGPYRAPHLLHPGTGTAGNFLSFFVIA